jgi:predicted PurR-regulated permease PerM
MTATDDAAASETGAAGTGPAPKSPAFIVADHPVADEIRPATDERIALIERGFLVLLVFGLFVGVLAVVKPFTIAILFGASLATAAWPLRQVLVRKGLSHGMSAAVLLLGSLAVIALPIVALAPNLAEQISDGVHGAQSYLASAPAQPAWLENIPLVGPRLTLVWDQMVKSEGNLQLLLAPYTADIKEFLVAAARGLAGSLGQLILSLIVATMLWSSGEVLVGTSRNVLSRLGGPTAAQMLDVAALAIRGVAYGVVGTAVIQAFLLAFGLAIAGVPGSAMLCFVGLLLALSQIGAPLIIPIWAGAAWWLFAQDQQVWGVFMIVWGLIISSIDNIIKPWLIGVGIDMPLSLTILGVFGGFVTFGFLGLFIGPTLIAIFLALLHAWRDEVMPQPRP